MEVGRNRGNVWRDWRDAEVFLEVHRVVENRLCGVNMCIETGVYTIRAVRDCKPTYRMCIDAIFHSTRCQGRYGRRPNLGLWRLLEVGRGGEDARRDG